MAESTNQTSSWFCGSASSQIGIQEVANLQQSCLLNGIYCIPHAVFIILAICVLIYKRFFHSEVQPLYKSPEKLLRLRYPFHDFRWTVFLILVILAFVQVGEGILTDTLVLDGGVHPQFFIPGILAFIATIVLMFCYDYTELWDRPQMLWLQVVYSLAAVVNEKLRFSDLRKIPEMNMSILKFDITLLMLMSYLTFIIIDAYLIFNRVSMN